MIKTLLIALTVLVSTTSAFAMDDAERARQMEAYNAQADVNASSETTAASEPVTAPVTTSTTTTTTVTSDTFESGRKSQKEREMDAYNAYVESSATPENTGEAMKDATTVILPAPAESGNVTTTVEKTTTTNYTVTKRKVGLVGSRPYPATTEEVSGGATMQKIVNGVEVESAVVEPDPVADLKNQPAEGDYYSGKPEAEVYVSADSNVRVHNTGSFNN